MKIAMIGAGIAGLACAELLERDGHDLSVFDKGRGPGGRMATRRVETPLGEVSFDHGAQYFTARDPDFVARVAEWAAAGVVARWPAAGADAWVGTPGMNALIKALAAPRAVAWNSRVETIARVDTGWMLDPVSQETFDAVIVATPAEQVAPLLAPHAPALATIAQRCHSAPCWTAMLAFATPIAISADTLRQTGIIGWAARNSAKPGRDAIEAWVVQATPEWSRDHLEDDAPSVVDALLAALAEQASAALPEAIVRTGHRWRYARVDATPRGALWDSALRIGAVGDWLVGPRIESAWRSGRTLAERIIASDTGR